MDLVLLDDFGTTKENNIHSDYCVYCMDKGSFTHNRTVEEMVEFNLKFLDEYNKEKGLNFTPEQARVELTKHLLSLKRWKK